MPTPGLGNEDFCHERRSSSSGGGDPSSCTFRLGYYQWTAWVLMLLAFLFYFPR